MYRACPSESCRRKVVEEPTNSGEYKCSKCDKKFPNFTWRYSIQAAIADFSDFHWVTIFEESASAILGMSADDLSWKKEENMIEYEKILEQQERNKELLFLIERYGIIMFALFFIFFNIIYWLHILWIL